MKCTKSRDLYDIGLGLQHEDDDTYTKYIPQNVNVTSTNDDPINWARMDVEEQYDNYGSFSSKLFFLISFQFKQLIGENRNNLLD